MTTDTPLLLYDGDCGFCTRSARQVERLPVRVDLAPWQEVNLARLCVTEARARGEVLLVERPKGTVRGGADAIAALLRRASGPWRLVGTVLALPVVRALAAAVYRTVSRNRQRLPGATPACQLPPEQRPGAGPRRS